MPIYKFSESLVLRGLSPERAILEAARERFRPIMMTTFAALLGAVPLTLGVGPGSELRQVVIDQEHRHRP